MPLKQAEIIAEQRGPLLMLLFTIPVLAFAGFKVHAAVADTGRYQQDVRIAQLVRSHALDLQLDEETGVRGYLATGHASYLEPYASAKPALAATFRELETRLSTLGVDGAPALAADESELNAQWLATVAEPLAAVRPGSSRVVPLMKRGKQLVDTFRARDAALQQLLSAAAIAADAGTERAIASLLVFVIAALIVLTGGAASFGFFQARTVRLAFANRILYENQKRIADSLQTAFLNKDLPVAPNLGLHATYVPATTEAQVGGDWYDAFELPDKRILFSIGDVAGHGLEAAIVMSRARQAIVAAALHEDDPAKVLERANEAILLQDARMVTAICGYIDPATLEIVYATAGHPPPVLARPGLPAIFLPHDGIPLGIMPNATYRTFVATASDGAVLVLYTDGVIEHKRDVIAGEARLLEAIRLAVLQDDPALAIHRLIFESAKPADDVAILTVRFKETGGQRPPMASVGGVQHNRWDVGAVERSSTDPQLPTSALDANSPDDIDALLKRLLFFA